MICFLAIFSWLTIAAGGGFFACNPEPEPFEVCTKPSDCATDYCVNGRCQPPPACQTDPDCSDGVFCNGAEACLAGMCANSAVPCEGAQKCNETLGTCVACLVDADCDDGLFCTGTETCVNGSCMAGVYPCLVPGCTEQFHCPNF